MAVAIYDPDKEKAIKIPLGRYLQTMVSNSDGQNPIVCPNCHREVLYSSIFFDIERHSPPKIKGMIISANGRSLRCDCGEEVSLEIIEKRGKDPVIYATVPRRIHLGRLGSFTLGRKKIPLGFDYSLKARKAFENE